MVGKEIETMSSKEAWLYAASWGSYIRSGDPGVCMYGFSEDCLPQSEDHRERVIKYCEQVCIPIIQEDPNQYDEDELDKMNKFLKYIKQANLS